MRFLTLLAILCIIAGSLLVLKPDWRQQVLDSTENFVQQTEQGGNDLLAPLTKHISTPEPLRGQLTGPVPTTLTESGVLQATNQHRQADGLPSLTRNATLDQAAERKLQDMFTRQYFEHVAPDGTGPGDLVTGVGYEFLTTGENLALGNFGSDTILVQAWMDSPGHRANILGQQFQEIGLAVGRGQFEGHTTWLAVQTFATPASACPLPDSQLKTTTESHLDTQAQLESSLPDIQAKIDQQQSTLDSLRQQIDTLRAEGQQLIAEGNAEIEKGNRLAEEGRRDEAEAHWERGEDLQRQGQAKLAQAEELTNTYNQQVEHIQQLQADYNAIVNQLQDIHATLSELTSQYNQQVQIYNACADQFTSE